GGRVMVQCQDALLLLLPSCPGVDAWVGYQEPLPDFDWHASLLSLPHILQLPFGRIAANVPYLAADSTLVQHWRERLQGFTGFKIGIAWQGSTAQTDQRRFMPLSSFGPLAAIPGVHLI